MKGITKKSESNPPWNLPLSQSGKVEYFGIRKEPFFRFYEREITLITPVFWKNVEILDFSFLKKQLLTHLF
ncbi:MAG TPA: hypothetical protein VMS83_06025 [Methanoregula sp.]|nr:hypothetical protein [Methanoregula sp.]